MLRSTVVKQTSAILQCQKTWFTVSRAPCCCYSTKGKQPLLVQAAASSLNSTNKIVRFRSTNTNQSKSFPFWQRLLFVSGIGGLLYYFFKDAIHFKEIEKEKTRYQELGKAQLGGDWTLTDHHGKKRSSTDFRGHWILLYFGFTHCPDICPEELEKLAHIVKTFDKDPSMPDIQPLFITLDPERDSPKVIKDYCAEFLPNLIGFTGSEDEIRQVCKKFRVYFGKGEPDENNDYIVDHTIIIYLINPEGEFVNYFGRSLTAETVCKSVSEHIQKYNELQQKKKL